MAEIAKKVVITQHIVVGNKAIPKGSVIYITDQGHGRHFVYAQTGEFIGSAYAIPCVELHDDPNAPNKML